MDGNSGGGQLITALNFKLLRLNRKKYTRFISFWIGTDRFNSRQLLSTSDGLMSVGESSLSF